MVADVEAVDAQLIGASGNGREGEQSAVRFTAQDFEARLRGAALFANAPLRAGQAVAADGSIDELFVSGDDAGNEGEVALLHAAMENWSASE